MKRFLTTLGAAFTLGGLALAQLTIPPKDAGNFDECFNSDGDGYSCCRYQQRSGSWVTGDSDGVDDVAVTEEGSVLISTGSLRKEIIDYRAYFNDGDPICGPDPIVETPHHTPFVMEFTRYFRTRASYVDYGLSKGWRENYFFLLNISSSAGYRNARFEVPSGTAMNWLDVGSTGNWINDDEGQSMVMSLTDEAGDQHLVTDRWGGKYHFVPNTTTRPFLQYLVDWLEDENGNRITLTYNAGGYPILASDGFGRSISYVWTGTTFNGTRHLRLVTLPNGRQLVMQHFFNSPQTYTLTYPNGEVASYGFGSDADGTFYYFNDPLGEPGARKQRVYTYYNGPSFQYDTGRVRGIKDETGHVQLIREESPSDPTITIEYDDGRGFAFDCAFTGLNENVINLRTGAVTHNEWQGNGGLLKTKVDPMGSWLGADYDNDHALRVLQHDIDTFQETWTYGPQNRVVDRVDPNGNLTHYTYDANGNLIRKTYADTSYEEWTRHPSGRVTDYRNRDGLVTSYQYDARGNVSQIVLPAEPSEANPVVAYTYDVDGRVLSKTDPVGRVTTYQYDLHDRLVQTNHPDSSTELIQYGTPNLLSSTDPVATAGVVVSRTDRNGNVTTYDYGANDRLVHEAGAPGDIVYTYDAQDRLVSRTENGDVEGYTYDAAMRRLSVTRDADATHQHVTTYQYDLLDRVIEIDDPHGFVTLMNHYPEGQLGTRERQIDGGSTQTTTFTYDPNGNVLTEDDDGDVLTSVYDSNDRLVRTYDPAPFDANYVEYTYDFEGHLLSRRDQSGNTAFYVYTNRGQVAQEIDASGVTVLHHYNLDDTLEKTQRPATLGEHSFTYDAGARRDGGTVVVDGGANDIVTTESNDGNGNAIQRIDGEGGVSNYEYDARNRVTRVVDPLGEETLTQYSDDGAPFDARLAAGQGSAVTVTDPNGYSRTTVYDGVGRVMREVDQAGASFVYTHDVISAGRVGTIRTDRMGRTTAEYRDGLERVVQTADEMNHLTGYTYDVHGNLIGVLDARGHSTAFGYDERGSRTGADYPELGDTLAFTYQANHWLSEKVDQEGNHTQYSYDGAGRLTNVHYQDGSDDTYAHDGGGRLVTATSGLYGNSVTLVYDRADRVVTDGNSGLVHIEYDRRSLETSITTPSGREFVYGYTGRGELDTISLNATTLVDNAYDAGGRLVQRDLGNGTSSSWDLDPRGWISGIVHSDGSEDILRLNYSRDGEGRKLRQRNLTNRFRTETFDYDLAGRLVSYHGKVPPFRPVPPGPFGPDKGLSKVQSWVLDQVGNWNQFNSNSLHEVRLHSDTNELVGISGIGALTYDKRGNLVEDGVLGYTYDFNNRLRAVHKLADDDPVADYTYDALGRRLRRTFLEKSTIATRRLVYCYAGERIVEIRVKPTVNDPDQFLEAFAHGSEPDQPLVMVRSNHTYYFHHDANGSTVALTKEDGSVAERYEYDPYGAGRAYTGQWYPVGDDSAVGNPFTFECRENDAEIGLLFFRERSMSPHLGRYLQRNPAGYAGGINLYSAATLVNGRSPHGLDD